MEEEEEDTDTEVEEFWVEESDDAIILFFERMKFQAETVYWSVKRFWKDHFAFFGGFGSNF